MDKDIQRKKRLEALEEKRKRLEEMKRLRNERADESISSPNLKQSSRETDDLVGAVLSKVRSPVASNSTAMDSPRMDERERTTGSSAAPMMTYKKQVTLSTVKSTFIVIPPEPPLTYDKECQTNEEDDIKVGDPEEATIKKTLSTPKTGVKFRNTVFGMLSSLKAQPKPAAPAPEQTALDKIGELQKSGKTYTPEEIQNIVTNDKDFSSFLNKASLKIERALEQNASIDVCRDYNKDDSKKSGRRGENNALTVLKIHEDDIVKNRPIMDIKQSPHVQELFLVAYGSKTSGPSHKAPAHAIGEEDAVGLVCVWSKELHSRPEFKFTATSPVVTALFHTSEHNLVVGGCYSGQILLWDTRAKTLPIQRSSMSGKGHKHPIYAMSMISLAVSNELVSVSTDGMVCHWDVSRLSEPLTVTFLNANGPSAFFRGGGSNTNLESAVTSPQTFTSLNVSSMAFCSNDTSTHIVFGSGTGQLYRTALPYRPTDNINEVRLNTNLY